MSITWTTLVHATNMFFYIIKQTRSRDYTSKLKALNNALLLNFCIETVELIDFVLWYNKSTPTRKQTGNAEKCRKMSITSNDMRYDANLRYIIHIDCQSHYILNNFYIYTISADSVPDEKQKNNCTRSVHVYCHETISEHCKRNEYNTKSS